MAPKNRLALRSVRANSRAACETLENRRLLSGLTGTIIGTSGSWHSQGNVAANAFDGNLNTFFDAPDGSGDWVGLNLGTPAIISDVKYAPRAIWSARTVGGIFQGSNTPDFSSGVVNLFTITAAPAYGVLTTAAVTDAVAFQYVRYIGPSASYCNIAELEFDGATVSTPPLPFTASGTAGSWENMGNVFTNAFDGNVNTFFDAPTGNGNFVGATFSSEAIISQISYAPRAGFPGRMVGGIFQGSNSATFASGVVNLYTITATPPVGVYTSVPIAGTIAYEYVRYVAPAGSYGNIAELVFDGTLTGVQATVPVNPSVITTSPANGATGVSTTAFVSCNLNLPNGGINPDTMTASTVYLYRTYDDTIIPTEVNTDAVGGVIVLQPQSPLAADTEYTFVVTAGVADDTGMAFIPYTMSFTTGAQVVPSDPTIAFAKVVLPTAVGQMFSGVTMGPDGNLYANTLTGGIFQYPVNANGTLGNPVNIAALANMPDRLITGLAFDPSSTATHMIIWISSGDPAEINAPDFSGTIGTITISTSAMTGLVVTPYQVDVTNLPRSNSNHLNDQPVFGPDGELYWCQGSNSSMGAPDDVWGYRPEHLLNAAILRLNIQLIEQYVATNNGPLNVQTDTLPAGQTAYNPYAAGAPLTIYATGIRNAYDLIWDTNGHLYAPTNGSASGGNIPGTPAGLTPAVPAENDVSQAEDDYLYDIVQGGYYGHPDPARGQYIFGGGNPTDPASDDAIQTAYPLGTNPDPNYRGYAYDFGVHYSPDGSVEYTGNAFGGALNGALLITEYSGGKDVDVLRTGSNGQITESELGIAGFTGFEDPVDIIEDPATGDLYVADLGTDSITLLTPIASGATISVSTPTLYFNAPVNGAASPVESFTITNTGTQPLAIPATGLSVSGTDGALFPLANEPALPAIIAPGASITVGMVFNPGNSALGLHTAVLQISSNDQVNPLVSVNLRGLTTAGIGGSSQPSLQAILNLYQIGDSVGTANAAQSYFTMPPATPNNEVVMQELEKAGTGPVTITPLAAFDANISPAAGFGYYAVGTADSRTQLFTLSSASSQSVDPVPSGTNSFDPGTSVFGIYGSFDALLDSATGTARIAFGEDALNTYSTSVPRLIRFYPLKNSSGTVVPNSFVFAIDDAAAAPLYQYTDLVGIITNVKAAPGAPVIGTQNISGSDNEAAPSPARLVFSAIQNSNGSSASVVHSTGDLRIDNSGSLPLVISSISSSNPFFTVALTYPVTIAAGGSLDVPVVYNPTHTGATALDSGTLSINSNDPVHPALAVQVAGIWQGSAPPALSQVVGTLGYTALGNETLASYWTRADGNLPVTVEQLAAYSGKTTGSTLYWYSQGHSTSDNSILSIPGDDTQSLLPLSNDRTGSPAIGSFSTSAVFGFSIDKTEFSDDTLNGRGSATDTGHHVKFYAVYNRAGVLVPNTWLMVMSYTSSNQPYAFTDNVYLVSNMRPAPPALPTGAMAVGNVSGNTFSWNAVSDPLSVGYLAYRSTISKTGYVELSSKPVVGTSFVDTTATPGIKYYYTVAAIDSSGTLSPFTSAVSATRTKDTVAPAVPLKLAAVATTATITLTWSPNAETDLAGYNVYRSNSASGTYFKLNASPLTSPIFADNSSPAGVTSFYLVTAVNLSGTESAAASVSATVPPSVTKSAVVNVGLM